MKKITFIAAFLLTALFATQSFAETYTIDASHSSVGFAVKHLLVSNTKGRFEKFSGTIDYDAADVSKSSVSATVETASINTDDEKRDGHLKSPDFFDVAKFPQITFVSKNVKKSGKNLKVTGTFTMHGVSKDVTIPVELSGPVKDFAGNNRIGATGSLVIKRSDYGVSWNKTLDQGGLVVGEDVTITLEIEAIAQK